MSLPERPWHAARDDFDAKTSPAYVAYLQAITAARLAKADEASRLLEEANRLAAQELADHKSAPAWNRALTLELFRLEAESLILPMGS